MEVKIELEKRLDRLYDEVKTIMQNMIPRATVIDTRVRYEETDDTIDVNMIESMNDFADTVKESKGAIHDRYALIMMLSNLVIWLQMNTKGDSSDRALVREVSDKVKDIYDKISENGR